MIVSDVLRAITVLSFLLVNSPERVWLLYVLTVTQFSLSALFTPARTAVLANIVARQDLVTANALDSLTWSTMLAFGAFLGGMVAAIFGTATAFIMDAATFILSAWFVSLIVSRAGTRPASERVRGQSWLEFAEGFKYLLGVPFILAISLVKGAGSLIWGAINVLEISYANNLFPISNPQIVQWLRLESGGAAALGAIYVMSGLGTGLGPLVARRFFGDGQQRMLWAITLGFVLLFAGIWGLSAAPDLLVFLGATFVRTVGSGIVWVFSAAMLQMLVPDQFRGRVFAFEFAVLTLTQSISTYGAGFFQDYGGLSVQDTTAVFGAAGFVVAALWFVLLMVFLKRRVQPDLV